MTRQLEGCFFLFFPIIQVDEDVYLAFAGISADGRVLASKIRLECQNYRYGMGVAPGIGYIARYVGEYSRHASMSTVRQPSFVYTVTP